MQEGCHPEHCSIRKQEGVTELTRQGEPVVNPAVQGQEREFDRRAKRLHPPSLCASEHITYNNWTIG